MAFCGGGALPQTIKQMQQRMLELKKTLQKELVSVPLLPAAHALLPLCSSCLMTLPPRGLQEVSGKSGWWDSGPATLNVLLESGSVTPGTNPLSLSLCVV